MLTVIVLLTKLLFRGRQLSRTSTLRRRSWINHQDVKICPPCCHPIYTILPNLKFIRSLQNGWISPWNIWLLTTNEETLIGTCGTKQKLINKCFRFWFLIFLIIFFFFPFSSSELLLASLTCIQILNKTFLLNSLNQTSIQHKTRATNISPDTFHLSPPI